MYDTATGVMAGMYRAQRREELQLRAKKRKQQRKLTPEEQVKYWRR